MKIERTGTVITIDCMDEEVAKSAEKKLRKSLGKIATYALKKGVQLSK